MESDEVLIKMNVDYANLEKAAAEMERQMMKIYGQYGDLEKKINAGVKVMADIMGNKTIPLQTAFVKTWDLAYKGVNGVIEAIRSLNSSAGMTNDQFSILNDSIRQAAAESGSDFKEIANNARNLFEATGLKEGLGEAVLNAERMNKVFNSSKDSFGKLAAKFTQFSEGAGNANDLMKAFNGVVGITGSRMDAVLDHMAGVGDKIRNIAGGGKSFATSMKANTEFTAKMAAKFAEMGGNPQAFMDINDAILDPKKWGELGKKMPGVANYFQEMQEAFATGDVESYAKYLKAASIQTAEMGRGMSVLQRSATGFDLTTAELLSGMDWGKIKNEAGDAGSVLERAAKQLRGLGEQIGVFFTNLAAALMPIIGPIIEKLSSALSSINAFLASSQGQVLSAIIGFTMLGIAIWMVWRTIARISMLFRKEAKTVGEATGEALGKVAEKSAEGAASGISKFVSILAKKAVQMIMLGAAFALMGAGLWMMAEAVATVAKLKFGDVMSGIGGLIIAVAAFTGVAMLLGLLAANPIFWFGLLALGAMGIALTVFAEAVEKIGNGINTAANAILTITTIGPKLGELSKLDLSGLTKIGESLKGFSDKSSGANIDTKVFDSLKGVVEVLGKMGSSMSEIINAGDLATKYGPQIKAAVEVVTQQLADAVTTLNDKLVHFFGNTTISDNVQKSLLFVVELFQKIPDAMIQMAAFGMTVTSSGLKEKIDKAIQMLFGTEGVFYSLSSKINSSYVNVSKLESFQKVAAGVSGMIDPMLSIAAAGMTFSNASFRDGLHSYIDRIRFFFTSMLGIYDSIGDRGFSKISKMPELMGQFRAVMDKDIKLSAEGGAKVALEEHDSVTRDHYAKVELLLTGILTAVKNKTVPESVQQSTRHSPNWDPAVLFGGNDEGTF